MSIKTIMVHLAPDDHSADRLAAAVNLTKDIGGHLLVLYVAAPVSLPAGAAGRGASAAYLAAARETAQENAGKVEAEARAACEGAGISWRWIYGESNHLEQIMEEVHHVDLTIIGQVSIDSFEDHLMLLLPEKLVIGAGGPVLVLPKGYKGIGLESLNSVLIAWSYSREAIRAVRDSLTLLSSASKVTLLTCGDDDAGSVSAPVLHYLERHGINAEHLHHGDSHHIGEEILVAASSVDADLIVMGAYGHTGFIDKLFGSVTRYVVGHTDAPLLISH